MIKTACCYVLFLLQVTEVANVGAGREREKKLRISVQFAAARGPTRRHRWGRVGRRAATVPPVPEGLPCNSWSF